MIQWHKPTELPPDGTALLQVDGHVIHGWVWRGHKNGVWDRNGPIAIFNGGCDNDADEIDPVPWISWNELEAFLFDSSQLDDRKQDINRGKDG